MKKTMALTAMLTMALFAAPLTFAQTAPAASGITVQCKDGTSQTVATTRGACRGHKGIDKSASASTPAAAAAPAAAPAAAAAPAPASAGITLQCKDGTSQTVATTRGACRGHKGIDKSASASTPAAAAPAATPAAAAAPAPAAAPTPAAAPAPTAAAPAAGGGNGQVWVNTGSKTKAYHCEGSKWYGKTKQGQYMTKAQAEAQGYHAGKGDKCS